MPDFHALTPCTCRQSIHAQEHQTPVDGCPWCSQDGSTAAEPVSDRPTALLAAITAEAARRGVISIDGIRNITGQQAGPPAAHQRLLTQLETDRAKMLRCAAAANEPEVQRVQEGIAAGLHTAAAWTIHLFEGDRARQAYLARAEGTPTDAGPSVAEAAANDRKWFNSEKVGE